MTFKQAVEQTANLENFWRDGLQALRSEDRLHIAPDDPRKLTGSADIDAALRPAEPTANRWDFAIGFQHTNRNKEFIYWVETHTGSDSQISIVLRKLDWLVNWLRLRARSSQCLSERLFGSRAERPHSQKAQPR